jgi:hypothetical protein
MISIECNIVLLGAREREIQAIQKANGKFPHQAINANDSGWLLRENGNTKVEE